MKPDFQNNDLSHIWDKLDEFSVNGDEYEFNYQSPNDIAVFPIITHIRNIGTKNYCLTGKLKRLFVNFKFSDVGAKDIYLLGVLQSTIFYSLPVISFVNTNNLYQFNFSPSFTTKNNDNTVLNIEINDIPIPQFDINLLNDGMFTSSPVYFVLSLRYDEVEPVTFLNRILNYFFIHYSLNLINTNENTY
jgi:hypothetical protein